MKTTNPYIAFILIMTGIIIAMCIFLTQMKAIYRHETRKIDATTTAAR